MLENIKLLEISADKNNDDEDRDKKTKRYENIVLRIYRDRRKFKDAIIDEWHTEDHFVGVVLDISKIDESMIKKYEIDFLVSNYPVKCCTVCGCHYLSYRMFTYRSNSGCVGTSYECVSCRGFNRDTIDQIIRVKNKDGVMAAKEYQMSLFVEDEEN